VFRKVCAGGEFVGCDASRKDSPKTEGPIAQLCEIRNYVMGDGHLDILATEGSSGVPSLELFTNAGEGAFAQTVRNVATKPNSGNLD